MKSSILCPSPYSSPISPLSDSRQSVKVCGDSANILLLTSTNSLQDWLWIWRHAAHWVYTCVSCLICQLIQTVSWEWILYILQSISACSAKSSRSHFLFWFSVLQLVAKTFCEKWLQTIMYNNIRWTTKLLC